VRGRLKILLRHSSAEGNARRVGTEPRRQHTLRLEKIARTVVKPGQIDRHIFIGWFCCSRLFEHADRIRESPAFS